ncbi:MAG TPA: hypothetical protein VHS81_04210, partial [Caulobacteraceae bacterium]|nr:hypothetical protein [Caulobacteraceae bacterium]
MEDVATLNPPAPAASTPAPLRVLRDTFSTEDGSDWAPHGNGGVWRRRQIDGILRRHGVEPVNMERPPGLSFPARMARSLVLKARFAADVPARRKTMGAAEYSDRFYTHNACRPGLTPVAVLESGSEPVAVAALKAQGFKVVVVMPAINSLWLGRPNPVTGPYPNGFQAELHALRMADNVFAIAREEQLLLNNLGLGVAYLPYYPDDERAETLFGERAGR